MRAFVVILVVILAFYPRSASAQIFTVTIQGNIEELGTGAFNPTPGQTTLTLNSSVHLGTPYTFTESIDANATTDSFGFYDSGSQFKTSLTMGSYDFVFDANETVIVSSAGSGIYFFPNPEVSTYGFTDLVSQVRLNNFGENELPDPGLSAALQAPLSDFDYNVMLLDYNLSTPLALGDVTSYTVTETPEPSICSLLLAGLGMLALCRYRMRSI